MMLRSIKLNSASNAVPELNDLLTALSPLETLDLLGNFWLEYPQCNLRTARIDLALSLTKRS